MSGGYNFLFINVFTCVNWFLELSKNSFQDFQCLACYINEKSVERSQSLFPRNNVDTAIVSNVTRTHLKGFQPSFSESLSFLSCTKQKVSYGCAPAPRNGLLNEGSNSHFHVGEKSIYLLEHLITFHFLQRDALLDSHA